MAATDTSKKPDEIVVAKGTDPGSDEAASSNATGSSSTTASDSESSAGINTPAETETSTDSDEEKSKDDEEKKDAKDEKVDKADKTDKDGEEKKKDGDEEKKDGDEEKKEGDEEEKPKKPLAPRGSLASPVNIYRSNKDQDGEYNWVDKCPEDVPEPAENDETAQYAVVVRNIKSPSSKKKLEAHSIVIQSALLREALAEILKDYPGVACELEELEFEAPFQPFVHRWREFVKYSEREDLSDATREHLKVLRDILDHEIGDLLKAFDDYMRNGVVKFDHMWMIFQPGSVVVCALRGPLSAFELKETEYMQNQCGRFLRVSVDCVDSSGKDFGRCAETIDIGEFLGTKKITGLRAYPITFHEDKDALAEKLVARGKVFEGLAGHHFKHYTGTAISWDKEGNEVKLYVTGRIVVDIASFNRWSPYYYPNRYVDDWTPKDMERIAAYKRIHGLNKDGGVLLPEYYRMLCRSRTRGYSLKLKKWLDFFVDDIGEIEFNTDAFDRLVLPDDQKELIMAFSESQLDANGGVGGTGKKDNDPDGEGGGFDDVIAGKGRGVICLLSGPPGVGKTLTAEAVAENLRVPLHTLSSGDLGSSPWEVENGLGRILELVARWNAILLLDECDVFLEARASHDLERNKVVSIFLRTLEYYEGILFMTTNRVANIDPAFQSRIHVSLEYPDLNNESRKTIWASFLGGSGKDGKDGGKDGKGAPVFTDADLTDLAELRLNGRQIKNVIKTAQLLASRKKDVLRRAYVDTVLAIEKRRPGGEGDAHSMYR